MVTKKTATCECKVCKCDPCECVNGSCTDSANCSSSWCNWGSALRISFAVGLIILAYFMGVWAGMDRDGKRDGPYMPLGEYGKHDMDKMLSMCMMDMSSMSHDPMDMSMRDMGKMLEGKTGDELNKAFLEGMIPHHQGAIDMAKYLAASNKPELVKLGADIITAQQKEIDQMNLWMKEWGYISTGNTNTGMKMHMMPDGTMMHGGM